VRALSPSLSTFDFRGAEQVLTSAARSCRSWCRASLRRSAASSTRTTSASRRPSSARPSAKGPSRRRCARSAARTTTRPGHRRTSSSWCVPFSLARLTFSLPVSLSRTLADRPDLHNSLAGPARPAHRGAPARHGGEERRDLRRDLPLRAEQERRDLGSGASPSRSYLFAHAAHDAEALLVPQYKGASPKRLERS
jgi:hypothetical protein